MYEIIILPLIGGTLIGIASALMLLLNGRIAGISGIAGGFLATRELWRGAFLGGMFAGGVALAVAFPQAFDTPDGRSLPVLAVAGLLVGFGTRLGSGCTSGHGVCGVSRLSKRSLVATLTFMAAGVVTTTLFRIATGGAQ